jgi:hypothetical protein
LNLFKDLEHDFCWEFEIGPMQKVVQNIQILDHANLIISETRKASVLYFKVWRSLKFIWKKFKLGPDPLVRPAPPDRVPGTIQTGATAVCRRPPFSPPPYPIACVPVENPLPFS